MKIYGTYQRLSISGLILTAFLLLVYNYSQVISLEGRPLKGNSPTIKMMESNLVKLDGLLAEKSDSISQRFLFSSFFERYEEKKADEPTPRLVADAVKIDSRPKAVEKLVLPVLAGIVEINDIAGKVRYKALFDDNIYQMGDAVGQYVLKKITDRGVLLQHGRRRWFIEKPQQHYSEAVGD